MKILCIMCQDIFCVKSGGAQCAKRNYDAIINTLQEGDVLYTCVITAESSFIENEKVEYIPELNNNVERVLAALQGRKCCKKKYEKKIWKLIEEIRPEVVYLDTSKLGKCAKYIKENYGCRVIVFFHNVESDYSLNFVWNKGRQYLLPYLASLINEKEVVKYADQLVCLNERDKMRIEKVYGRSPETIIPISLSDKLQKEKINVDWSRGILFVGSLFPPNYQGIRWFVNEVMSRLPNEHLTIVGKGFEEKKAELERKNVTIIGTVEDVSSCYYMYPIVVMPIQYGSGMKVKTAEAMMYGKTILATDEALEGYEVNGVKGIFRCNTAEQFVDAIKKVMSEKINSFNEGVRELFLEHYEFGATCRQFEKLIREPEE
ncbi:MAG: glycosyltransferase family 4 protein [bacterium]|nr:glycosyltransferase family 4 protein [bacterium]